jgi:iron complex outermembrane receptor protein
VWSEHRDYAQGCLTFVPSTIERSLAGYFYDERTRGRLTWQSALRLDYRDVSPSRREENRAGVVRHRDFVGVSASVSARCALAPGWTAAATVMRAFNAPGVEELYSDGPHLAAFAYEIGNANLNEETTTALEVSLQMNARSLSARANLFYNQSGNYIYPAFTGDTIYGVGTSGRLQEFQYTGQEATHTGGELVMTWRAAQDVSLSGTLSYVRGHLTNQDRPLPFIPPLSGGLTARWMPGRYSFAAGVRGAAEQNRLGEFESPTAGYVVFDVTGQYDFPAWSLLHSVVLSIQNLTNAEYRNHLSRVKSIMPEAGVNAKLLYKLSL